jgi:hypothetical protein
VSGYTGCWIVPNGLASSAALKPVDLRQQSPDIRLCRLASIGIRATTNIVAQFLPRLKSRVSLRSVYEWTAWVEGAPLITYHFYWTMGYDIEPRWDFGDSRYRVVIEGNPPLELNLSGREDPDGRRPFLGLPWTALVGVTAIPQVCDAAPGVVTHLDLGVVRPRGLVRR